MYPSETWKGCQRFFTHWFYTLGNPFLGGPLPWVNGLKLLAFQVAKPMKAMKMKKAGAPRSGGGERTAAARVKPKMCDAVKAPCDLLDVCHCLPPMILLLLAACTDSLLRNCPVDHSHGTLEAEVQSLRNHQPSRYLLSRASWWSLSVAGLHEDHDSRWSYEGVHFRRGPS